MLTNQWLDIPGGTFIFRVRHRIMEGDCQVDHGPALLTIPPFQMQKYPVTNGMYQTFVMETGYRPRDEANFLRQLEEGPVNEDAPVTWVSPADAAAYARWVGGQLPSDVQWQYAAGGPERTRWPWGEAYRPECLNASGGVLTPVDQYAAGASAWGLMDLCGNAWEWVQGPVDDGTHLFGLVRGGCCYRARHFWHLMGGPHPVDSHEKVPLMNEALNRSAMVGFRCVREVRER